MSAPLVSVVIPSWNRAVLLGDALDSVFAQEYSRLQVIVVDDGSTDDTQALTARYPAVEFFYQEHQGSAVARNTGIDRARGEYVAFLDSDDVWLPGKLRTELELFRKHQGAGAIISDSEHWLRDTRVRTSRFEATGLGTPATDEWFLPRDTTLWVDVSLFSTCCVILTRAALEAIGTPVFDFTLPANEDWDFEIRMYQACAVLVCPRVLARVRRYPDNTRGNRAIPGTKATDEQLRGAALRHRSIMKRAGSLPGLTAQQRERIQDKIAVLDVRIAELDPIPSAL